MDSSLDHRWMCEKMVGAYDIKTIFCRENSCSMDVNPRRVRNFNIVPQWLGP